MDKDAIAGIVSELEQVLSDHPHQVSFLQEFRAALAKDDIATTTRLYSSLEMWGGSGSVADVYLPSREADQRLKSLLIELNDQFEDAGLAFPRATGWAEVFRDWRDAGL